MGVTRIYSVQKDIPLTVLHLFKLCEANTAHHKDLPYVLQECTSHPGPSKNGTLFL